MKKTSLILQFSYIFFLSWNLPLIINQRYWDIMIFDLIYVVGYYRLFFCVEKKHYFICVCLYSVVSIVFSLYNDSFLHAFINPFFL